MDMDLSSQHQTGSLPIVKTPISLYDAIYHQHYKEAWDEETDEQHLKWEASRAYCRQQEATRPHRGWNIPQNIND